MTIAILVGAWTVASVVMGLLLGGLLRIFARCRPVDDVDLFDLAREDAVQVCSRPRACLFGPFEGSELPLSAANAVGSAVSWWCPKLAVFCGGEPRDCGVRDRNRGGLGQRPDGFASPHDHGNNDGHESSAER